MVTALISIIEPNPRPFEDVGNDAIVRDASLHRVRLLGSACGQPVHCLQGTQDIDMRTAFPLRMISGLDMRPSQDGYNSVPDNAVAACRNRQSVIMGRIVILIESQDQETVVGLGPLIVPIQVLPEPGISRLYVPRRPAVMHIIPKLGITKHTVGNFS